MKRVHFGEKMAFLSKKCNIRDVAKLAIIMKKEPLVVKNDTFLEIRSSIMKEHFLLEGPSRMVPPTLLIKYPITNEILQHFYSFILERAFHSITLSLSRD